MLLENIEVLDENQLVRMVTSLVERLADVQREKIWNSLKFWAQHWEVDDVACVVLSADVTDGGDWFYSSYVDLCDDYGDACDADDSVREIASHLIDESVAALTRWDPPASEHDYVLVDLVGRSVEMRNRETDRRSPNVQWTLLASAR